MEKKWEQIVCKNFLKKIQKNLEAVKRRKFIISK